MGTECAELVNAYISNKYYFTMKSSGMAVWLIAFS